MEKMIADKEFSPLEDEGGQFYWALGDLKLSPTSEGT